MKSRNWFLVTAVMIITTCFVAGLQAQNAAAQARVNQVRAAQRQGVRPGPEAQPYMQEALNHLRQAEAALQRGAGDKGGHRVRAIQRVKQAEIEVQAGIQYANTH